MVALSARTNALDSFGTKSPSKTDPILAMEAAGGLFGLRKVPLSEFTGCKANDDLHVVVRTDTDQAIGQVGKHYETLSNEEFFVPTVNTLVEKTGARIERFQLLDNGTRSFMRLSWPDDKNLSIGRPEVGDIVGRRCTLSTSHNGQWAGKFSLQMLRLICSNGMTVPVGNCEISLTHSICGRQQLIDLQELIPTMERYIRQFEAAANILSETPVFSTSEKAINIVKKIVDPTDNAEVRKDGQPNSAQSRVNHIMTLFDGGQPGATTHECKNTGWGLYNAAVDYFTHDKKTRGNDSSLRFKSLLPGGAANKGIVRSWGIVTEGLGITDAIDQELALIN